MRNTINRDRLLSSPRLQSQPPTIFPPRTQGAVALSARAILLPLAALLMLIASACGSSTADATPTLSVDAIYTAAFQTFSAQQATQLALTPPTQTPSPTLFPTLAAPSTLFPFGTATASSGGASACDNSIFNADVTIPDGTTIAAGKAFVKTWSLQNNGSCAWSTSYKLSFASGDQMGGSDVGIASAVASGSTTNISVNLVAPTADGSYKGSWQMKNAAGAPFGNVITVVIKVGTGSTATAGPTSATGKVTISGKAVADTTISYTGGTDFQTTGSSYSFTVPSGWSGTVTPSKPKYVFSPLSRTYTNVTSDLAGENYSATSITPTP